MLSSASHTDESPTDLFCLDIPVSRKRNLNKKKEVRSSAAEKLENRSKMGTAGERLLSGGDHTLKVLDA